MNHTSSSASQPVKICTRTRPCGHKQHQMPKAALLLQAPPEGDDQARLPSSPWPGALLYLHSSPPGLCLTSRTAPKGVGTQLLCVSLQCEQHHWAERMEPNFTECTMKGQEMIGTCCSKRNSHCAPRKTQFFTTSMVSPETGVQKSSWVYPTRHSHEPPELPLKLALLWAKDFRSPFQPCFLSNSFQYFVLPQHPKRQSPAAITPGTLKTPIPKYLGCLEETFWCSPAHAALHQQPGGSHSCLLHPAAITDSPNLDLPTLPDH